MIAFIKYVTKERMWILHKNEYLLLVINFYTVSLDVLTNVNTKEQGIS